jgi:hypothetical protein
MELDTYSKLQDYMANTTFEEKRAFDDLYLDCRTALQKKWISEGAKAFGFSSALSETGCLIETATYVFCTIPTTMYFINRRAEYHICVQPAIQKSYPDMFWEYADEGYERILPDMDSALTCKENLQILAGLPASPLHLKQQCQKLQIQLGHIVESNDCESRPL